MDLEMTGLDPARHVIVEIATLVTDDELNLVAEGPDLVVGATEDELGEMDEYVTNMHNKSGLLNQIRSSTISLDKRRRPDPCLPQRAHTRARHGSAVR